MTWGIEGVYVLLAFVLAGAFVWALDRYEDHRQGRGSC